MLQWNALSSDIFWLFGENGFPVGVNLLELCVSEFMGQTQLFRYDLNKSLSYIMQLSSPGRRGYWVKTKTWTRSQEAEVLGCLDNLKQVDLMLHVLVPSLTKIQLSVLHLFHIIQKVSNVIINMHTLTYTQQCMCTHKSTSESFSFYYSNQQRKTLWESQGHGAWAGDHPSEEGVGKGTAHRSWSK